MAHAHLAFELDGFEEPEETVAENINGGRGSGTFHSPVALEHAGRAASVGRSRASTT